MFEKAVATSTLSGGDIQQLADQGEEPGRDLRGTGGGRRAGGLRRVPAGIRPGPERGRRESLEVSPTLAHDTEEHGARGGTALAAVNRTTSKIKIPGTREGLPAITRPGGGNQRQRDTPVFRPALCEVINAFMSGMEAFFLTPAASTQRAPCSVASFFVSRLDGKVDPMLERAANSGRVFAGQLRGGVAIANATAASIGSGSHCICRAGAGSLPRGLSAAPTLGFHQQEGPAAVRTLLRRGPHRTAHRGRLAPGEARRVQRARAACLHLVEQSPRRPGDAGARPSTVSTSGPSPAISRPTASPSSRHPTARSSGHRGQGRRSGGALNMWRFLRGISLTWWIIIAMVIGIPSGGLMRPVDGHRGRGQAPAAARRSSCG